MSFTHALFPTPVFVSKLDRELTNDEWSVINDHRSVVNRNYGNWTSQDSKILEDEKMFELKNFCVGSVKEYFETIICTSNDIEPYITLSWLNYTDKNGYHHRHVHNNSIISGVFYISVAEDDRIYFHNDRQRQIDFFTETYNNFNSQAWWIPAKKNSLLMFPSELPHSVKTHETEDTRISLSFNVFVKGKIGNKLDLSWIELN